MKMDKAEAERLLVLLSEPSVLWCRADTADLRDAVIDLRHAVRALITAVAA